MSETRLRTSIEAWAIGFFATLGLPLACNSATENVGDVANSNGDQRGDDSDASVVSDAGPAVPGPRPAVEAGGPVVPGPRPGMNQEPSIPIATPPGSVAPPGPGSEPEPMAEPMTEEPEVAGPTVPTTSPTTSSPPDAGPSEAGYRPCVGPTPALDFEGNESNLVECNGGMLHRPRAARCPSTVPRAQPGLPADAGVGDASLPVDPYDYYECDVDAECTDGLYGQCVSDGLDGTYCDYGCTRDEDCGSSSVCLCDSPVGHCVSAGCATNADCTDGAKCAAYFNYDCGYNVIPTGFACQLTVDECAGPQDCEGENPTCRAPYDDESGRVCEGMPDFVCGRPFVVDGQARLAVATARSWSRHQASPNLPEDAATRAALARHWTEVGAMEHASVAAFARFSLQLLSLGAPASLLKQSQQAMADELAHAELAFSLASAYQAHPVGPGPLAMNGAFADNSPTAILELVILEGCCGETLAALEAREAASHTTDPVVRAALERISTDETRHAALAWRALGWALSQPGAESLRPSVERAMQAALAALAETNAPDTRGQVHFELDLSQHGVLPSVLRAELRRAAREVLAEGFRQILTGVASSAASDVPERKSAGLPGLSPMVG